MIDSIFRSGKNYYPQMFLQEDAYIYITCKLEISSDDETSDEENYSKLNSDEEYYSEE